MKILIFGRWRTEQPGGPDAVVLNLTHEFRKAGHEVTIWTPRRSAKRVKEWTSPEGVAVADLPSRGLLPFLPAETARYLECQSGAFDFALFFSVFTPFNLLAARRVRCPYGTAPLGGYAPASIRARGHLRKRLLLALAERAYLEKAHFVNVWSPEEQRDVELISRPQRCVVTPPGFNFPEMPARLPRSAGPGRRILFLGRFAIEHKGLDRLVTAFGEAAGAHDRLTLAGADFRGSLSRLKALAEASPTAGQIEFEGVAYGDVKYTLFNRADIFTHLSRWEGTPLAVVEALAFGMPALVSEETNLGSLIRRYDAGWVVEKGAPGKAAMQAALCATAAELDEKGRNARRLVETEFRWDAGAARLVEAMAKRGPDPAEVAS